MIRLRYIVTIPKYPHKRRLWRQLTPALPAVESALDSLSFKNVTVPKEEVIAMIPLTMEAIALYPGEDSK